MKITSVNNPKIKEYLKLHTNKHQKTQQQYIVETEHLVEEAIKAGVVDVIITTDEDYDFEKIIHVSDNVMKKLSNLHSPSAYMAICHLTQSMFDMNSNFLILDGVQDPGNVGTILRSALAFNIKNVIVSEDTANIYQHKVIQSSQGAIFSLNIKRSDLVEEIKKLKNEQYEIIGTALKDASVLTRNDHYPKYALILGNEGQGMNANIKELCDELKYIEIANIDSLNVAISAGIMMYQLQDK